MPSQTALALHRKVPAVAARRSTVEPVSRALSLLAAFGPQDLWLGNSELALRTGLPPSTVTRQGQGLVTLGYMHYDPQHRKYRLAAPALGLGYAAIAHSEVQRLARAEMRAFADKHKLHVTLCTRDRLHLVLLESAISREADLPLDLNVGTRMSLATSPMGWALLAALPEVERYYLLANVERRMPREWKWLRRRSSEAISQVYALGYCTSLGEWDPDLGILAVPLMIPGNAPLVLACVGASTNMSRARIERCLGPRLVGVAAAIQEQAGGLE
jgi:DNA-binding IclR family transcriptional regulator